MTREELIHFMEWWDKRYYPSRLQFHREKDADKYLAEHSIPPAEGAEEMSAREYLDKWMDEHHHLSDRLIGWSVAADFAEDFATLHAQRLAEKMVSERLRGELIAYDRWMSSQKWGVRELSSPETTVNEYLNTREK
jgi:hypothetical protein